MQTVDSLRCPGWGKLSLAPAYEFHTCKWLDQHTLSDAPLHGSYATNFHQLGGPFTACPLTNNLLVQVIHLTADAHPPGSANLRPISADHLQTHMH
ncbi:hypothetical protein O181_018768 [Austropuccinia psidii MF-1]|uniref:Uncharacterized protein n=1 Tax=Austropuccinia psidii MF-1 TaxID=1389203 RepID=A0A9Q3C9P8_9BASI|nr:hypothetical protein [Austropuccinia psidii MF-1]